MNKNLSNKLSGVILVLYILWAFIIKIFLSASIPPGLSIVIDLTLQLAFFVVHALGRYTVKDILLFFIFGFVISNIVENIGVSTGFPFGRYHHTDLLGPKLFLVPLLVAPSYIAMGYVSWTVAQSLIGCYNFIQFRKTIIILPLISAFILGAWDLCFDAVQSTLFKVWIWEKGGPHFGVPIENYFGWILNGFLFFFAFAFYLSRKNGDLQNIPTPAKSYWYQAALFYGAVAGGIIISYMNYPLFTTQDITGKEWYSGDVYQSLIITAVYTMIFITILALVRIRQDENIPVKKFDDNLDKTDI